MKKIVPILLLAVFSLSQYGKFISYAYCLVQAEGTAATCDCEKQLTDSKNSSEHATQVALKDKNEEPYITTDLMTLNLDTPQSKNSFTSKLFIPAKGFERTLLHPPALS